MLAPDRDQKLRTRLENLLAVVENATGDCEKADAAERRMIEELRQMGNNEALVAWAECGIEGRSPAAPGRSSTSEISTTLLPSRSAVGVTVRPAASLHPRGPHHP